MKVGKKNLPDILKMSISELEEFFKTIKLNKVDSEISKRIIKEIKSRIDYMLNVGLG